MAELSRTISHAEYMEWQEYYSIEPWGSEIDDQRTGHVAAVIANVNRNKGAAPFDWHDFTPWNARHRKTPPEIVPPDDPDAHAEQLILLFEAATQKQPSEATP